MVIAGSSIAFLSSTHKHSHTPVIPSLYLATSDESTNLIKKATHKNAAYLTSWINRAKGEKNEK